MYKIVTLLFIITACNNAKPIKTQSDLPADTANFYPIGNFIASQIQYVDLRNFIIKKKVGSIKFSDSSIINKAEFLQIATPIRYKINDWNSIKHLYKESVFQDLGTASYTINYTAKSLSTPIQNIDILLNEQTNIPKRLFIKERINKLDTSIIIQYNWIADRSFQMNQSKRTSTHFNAESKLEVSWNEPNK